MDPENGSTTTFSYCPPLELSSVRTIIIRDHNHPYSFTLSRVTEKEWLKYFDGIVSSSERSGKQTINTFDAMSSMLPMVERLLLTAEGYTPKDGKQLSEMENWQQKIPLRHRLAIAEVLTSVTVVDSDDEDPLEAGSEVVKLSALWNAIGGSMVRYSPLVHRFRAPEFDHQRRYMRDQSRSVVVGGARTGKTLWQGVQRTLIDIYDDLIESVDGYAWSGAPLDSKAQIVENMDAYQKVAAARQLFVAAQVEEAEATA